MARSEARGFLAGFVSRSGPYNVLALDGFLGGKFFVPDDQVSNYYEALAADVDHGTGAQNCLVECHAPEKFRLHFDVDLVAPTYQLDMVCEKVVPVVSRQTAALYGLEVVHCVVAAAPWKYVDSAQDEGPKVKTGVHLYLSSTTPEDAIVTSQQVALQLRTRIVQALVKSLGAEYNWDVVLDASVLNSNGLRQLWQVKVSPCPQCRILTKQALKKHAHLAETHGLGDPTCQICALARSYLVSQSALHRNCKSGRIYDAKSSVYVPHCIVQVSHTGDVLLVEMAQDMPDFKTVRWLHLTRVRAMQSEACPEPVVFINCALPPLSGTIGRPPRAPRPALESSDPLVRAVNDWLATCDLWAEDGDRPDGAKVKLLDPDVFGKYAIDIIPRSYHRCANVGREHVSNRVFFRFVGGKLIQKCFKCVGYESDALPRPDLSEVLSAVWK